jgi:hypothetical protein
MVARLLSDGYTPGGIAGAIANGSSATPKRLYGVKTTAIALPEPTVVTVTGDDTRLGIFQFDSENLPSFPLTAGEMDADIVAASQGSSIYTVGGYYDISLLGPTGRDFNDMLLWIVSQAKSRVSGNKGAGFHSLLVPRCTMTYLGLIGNNALGKDEGVMFELFTNKRPQFLVIVDDGVTNSFTLDHVPWTDGNGNVRFIAWRNGVIVGSTADTALVSVAANKTVSLTSLTGRSAGDKIFIFAEVA